MKAQIKIETDTKRDLMVLKSEKMFRTYDETLRYLIFVHKSLSDEERKKIEEKYKEVYKK